MVTVEKVIKNGVEYEMGGGGGTKYACVDILVVGAGGPGGTYKSSYYTGGGGGAGGFIECMSYIFTNECLERPINVGKTYTNYNCSGITATESHSCALGLVAYGGGIGATHNGSSNIGPKEGASGGGGNSSGGGGANGTSGQGNAGGSGGGGCGGGGGGAGSAGSAGLGGTGKCSSISGSLQWYAGGGAGKGGTGGCGGGGNDNSAATYYGGGGGATGNQHCAGCPGYQGIVIIRYKKDGSCGLKMSGGGCRYECGDYYIHCFTNTNTTESFIPVFK